jgi:hypothetical protein
MPHTMPMMLAAVRDVSWAFCVGMLGEGEGECGEGASGVGREGRHGWLGDVGLG